MLTIREFDYSDADYEAMISLVNAIWPDEPSSIEGTRYWDDARDRKYMFKRFVTELQGVVVGYVSCGESSWDHIPGKYFIQVRILPDRQRRGIGSSLYDHAVEILSGRELKPTMLTSYAREDQPQGVRFLTSRGYERTMRDEVSWLTLADFDEERFRGAEEKVLEQGVEIRTFAELEGIDPKLREKMWELTYELLKDVPSPDPITKQPFEQFLKWLESPSFLPDAWFIATHDGAYVGMTELAKRLAAPDRLGTGLTGVVRSHRRRGIATGLKVRGIRFAKEYGARVIETDNEESNPMYGLNVELGFKPRPGWLSFKKTLTADN
jgi:GNAT superfamily N-acetyltransferase